MAGDMDIHGSAAVPLIRFTYKYGSEFVESQLRLTNVAGRDVHCRITIHDHVGTDVSDLHVLDIGTSTSGEGVCLDSGSHAFSLPAGGTRYISLRSKDQGETFTGYLLVEWSCPDQSVMTALVGGCRYFGRTGSDTMLAGFTLINNGQPF